MNDDQPRQRQAKKVAIERQVDAICRRFEAAWRAGENPHIELRIEDIDEPGRAVLVCELIALERELRAERGELPEPSEYLQRFPAFAHVVETAFDDQRLPGDDTQREALEACAALSAETVDGATLPNAESGEAQETVDDQVVTVRYFGDYELLRVLARGGMGIVYEARQVNLNRVVALKMILAGHFASDADVKRFYLEAEAAARLDHSGIVPIFEVGQHEGRHFYSMGFVDGQSLAQKVAGGPLPPRDAAALIREVAEAVQYAHDHRVVHRDLKPANVLLDARGRPRVTDFGLAKKLEGDSGLTVSGQVVGTPSYMPPEQASGRSDVGPLADVYSMGAVLYHLLTGRPPFQSAGVMDTLKQVLEREPVSPRQLNASLPRDLETICLKCLQKDPARRYDSARALGEDLQRFLDDRPILARPVGRVEQAWRWCRRRPALAGALASAGVLLLTVAIGGPLAAVRESGLRGVAQQRESRALAAEKLAHARTLQAIHSLAESRLSQAEVLETSRQVGRRERALGLMAGAAGTGGAARPVTGE